jgi:hypothetical protein
MFLQNLFRKKKEVSPFLNMDFFYKDNDGLKWYEFNDKTRMPLQRYIKLQKFIVIWNRNLDNEELNKLVDIAVEAIEDGVKKTVSGKQINLLKVVTALNEIKTRQDKLRPFEVMADILAISYVRSDEDFFDFDNTKHMEKKQHIMYQAKKKRSVFYRNECFQEAFKLCNWFEGRFGAVLGVVGTGKRSDKKGDRVFEFFKIANQNEKQFHELLMNISEGDIVQYNELKRLNCIDFLLKFEQYIKDIEKSKKDGK